MTRKLLFIALLLIVAELGATAVLYPHMPERVPMHWNLHGQADGFGPRAGLFFFGPGMLAGLLLLAALLPWLSPRRFSISTFEETYSRIFVNILLLLAYIHAVMLWAASVHAIDPGRAITAGACLLMVLLGNLMGKVRRNFYIGIRTPWTLASERVWNATHRFGARAMVLAGLLGCILAASGFYLAAIALLCLGSAAPVLYSLLYSKQLERRGELEENAPGAKG
jgi:uncharacterized membrane protein